MADQNLVNEIDAGVNALEAGLPGPLPALLNNPVADAGEKKLIALGLDALGPKFDQLEQKVEAQAADLWAKFEAHVPAWAKPFVDGIAATAKTDALASTFGHVGPAAAKWISSHTGAELDAKLGV